MRAVVITRAGGPEVLELRDVPTPEPGHGEVRVRVVASALNRADLMQRMGVYPAPPGVVADIPGLEFAGVVDALGPGVVDTRCGERVFGIVAGGGHAEYVVTHERMLARVPDTMDDLHAAAVPEAFITAHDALVTLGGARAGSRVLVHAVGSGVGLAAVQIASALRARAVLGTARSADKLSRAKRFGVTHALGIEHFGDEARTVTTGAGVDVIVDFVGADYLARNVQALAPRGRLVVVGLLGGTQGEIDLGALMRKRATVVGTMLRGRPLEEKIAATRAFEREIVPLLDLGVLQSVVDQVVPLADVRTAHARMADNANFGKIVLKM